MIWPGVPISPLRSPRLETLYSSSGKVYFWDVKTGKQIEQTALQEKGCIALAMSPGGKTLAMGTITGLRL